MTQDAMITGAGAVAKAPDDLRGFGGLLVPPPAPPPGRVRVIEPMRTVPRPAPVVIVDFAETAGAALPQGSLRLRGTVLHRRTDVLLFGPNLLVNTEGQWSCEVPEQGAAVLRQLQQPGFAALFPGPKPSLVQTSGGTMLDMGSLASADVILLDEPVFLATPLRPHDAALWLLTMPAKLAQLRAEGAGRRFLCAVATEQERQLLRKLGLADAALLRHDPGRTYLCRDVMSLCFAGDGMTLGADARAVYFEIVATTPRHAAPPRRLFVPRNAPRPGQPRGLRQAGELAGALEALGFTSIEPGTLPLDEQIGLFAAAEEIVFVGVETVHNAVFCAPDAQVVAVATAEEAWGAANLLAALGLRHGLVLGTRDTAVPNPHIHGWSIDVDRAAPLIARFFRGS